MLTRRQFENLFDKYVDDVTAFLYTYASGRSQLEDLVQGVFLRIWEVRDQIDFDHPAFKSYLLKTARNHALKKLRKEKQYNKWLEENLERLTDFHTQEEPVVNPPDFRETYQAALSRIPPGARKVYLLSREDGLTYPEIAAAMNISVKTVEAQISKALRVLRKELKGYPRV